MGCHFILQRIFPTQGSNPGLLHGRQTLYHLSHQGSPKNTGVGCHSLLQEIFPTQGLNLGLLHCRQTLYHLSHQGSPTSKRSNPTSKERWLNGCRRAKRSYSTFKVRRGNLVQGKEQQLRFAGAAMKRYPTSKVRETQVRELTRASKPDCGIATT